MTLGSRHLSSGNLLEPLLAHADSGAEREALADASRSLTYGQLVVEARRRASVLREEGVRPGDRVLLVAANSVDQLVGHFSILLSGAISIPIEGAAPEDRVGFIVGDCEPKAIVADDKALAVAAKVTGASRCVLSLSQWQARAADAAPADYRRRAPDDIVCLMYTTGSTGRPKAAVLTWRGLGSALEHIMEYVGCDASDREAVVLPLSHSFGLGHAYCTLLSGGFLWVSDGLRPAGVLFDALARRRLNAMPVTPSMLRLLLGPYRAAFLGKAAGLRRLVINSEPLPAEQAGDVVAAFPKADIIVYYGLTEASRSTFLRLREEPVGRYRTVGRPAPRVQVQIRDESGEQVSPGTEGEVCLHGPHLAAGYWRRPDEQAEAFRGGWMHTGDLGALDSDGYLTITGRIKDQINVGGLKVAATEIESALRRHPLVADVAAVGLADPDGLRGEVVAVAIVARDSSLSVPDIAAFCDTHLATAAQPRRIALVDAIPRATTGKALREDLRRMLENTDHAHRTA
jgi:acyl-CoA synthetase (AMP-forming)/AMP-acid ligase II